jgi:biotin carboxylase
MNDKRVLVAGTTPDYVELIRKRWPGRALFLTDRQHREGAAEPAPEAVEEVVSDLSDYAKAIEDLKAHLSRHTLVLSGVTCYDCESLELASVIAGLWKLPFHSAGPVLLSRSKHESKVAWLGKGVCCPSFALAGNEGELAEALSKTGLPAVLKPLTGAGSELVFRCGTAGEASKTLSFILDALSSHNDQRMYPAGGENSPRSRVVVEEWLDLTEFSCEFVLTAEGAKVFRVAEKIRELKDGSSPRAVAYLVPALARTGVGREELDRFMERAARALGFEAGIMMADFFVKGGRPVILELTPRPSGDCIPHLTLLSSGFYTIGAALDLAEGKPLSLPGEKDYRATAGLRLLAKEAGVIKSLDAGKIAAAPGVREVYLRRNPGHLVALPPEDYDSFVLGHVLFEPDPAKSLEGQCEELSSLLAVEYEGAR